MNKVLITGGSGFIGRHTIQRLISRGYEVHLVYTTTPFHHPGAISYQCNLLDPIQTMELIKSVSPTHLLHLAWYTEHGKYWNSEKNLDWVSASLHLLKTFIQQGGKRIVAAGTCAEYDWNTGICHENQTPLNPTSLYGECKGSLYRIFNAYAKQMSCSYAWGRVYCLYGPYEYPQRLIPSVIKSILSRSKAKCTHGMQIRDYLYVEDAADAFVDLLDSQIEGAVNIASGHPITLKELVLQIDEKLGCEALVDFGAIETNKNDAACIAADVTRLSCELKWQPAHTLEEGLHKTIAWWKNHLQI